MKKTTEERMKKAMEENVKADIIALKTLGFDSVEDFIKEKLKKI